MTWFNQFLNACMYDYICICGDSRKPIIIIIAYRQWHLAGLPSLSRPSYRKQMRIPQMFGPYVGSLIGKDLVLMQYEGAEVILRERAEWETH